MSFALAVGNDGPFFFWSWNSFEFLAMYFPSAFRNAFSNAPPLPAPFIGSGSFTLPPTTVAPGPARIASTAVCCAAVTGFTPANRSWRRVPAAAFALKLPIAAIVFGILASSRPLPGLSGSTACSVK
jgi:hypothetical protein